MKSAFPFLLNIWNHLVLQTASHTERANEVFVSLEEAYQSPQRFYHTFMHIESMLRLIEETNLLIVNKEALQYACFFHDVVYDTRSQQNEEDSAKWAREKMSVLGSSEEIIEKTLHLILLTKSHTLPANASLDEQLFVDIDIAILGAAPEKYKTYAEQIRNEYAHYPDDVYQGGRQRVLVHFLSHTSLFHTHILKERFGTQARHNLQWELNQLQK